MKTKEAINAIKETIGCMNFCGFCTTGNCKECERHNAKIGAIAAIEKQIPHKVRDISSDGIERYVCECDNLMHRKQAYCDKCGQRLEA